MNKLNYVFCLIYEISNTVVGCVTAKLNVAREQKQIISHQNSKLSRVIQKEAQQKSEQQKTQK